LQGGILQLENEIAGLQARRPQLAAAIDRANQKANVLPENDATLSGLRLEAATAQTAYTSLRATYDAAVADAASLTPDGTLIDTATPPLYPDKPWRWLFALIGLFLGGLAGLGLGFAVESWGRSPGGFGLSLPAAGTGDKQQLVLASQVRNQSFQKDS
jgi:uncharacterized protein involved in exopolysaccharide biosynthesis